MNRKLNSKVLLHAFKTGVCIEERSLATLLIVDELKLHVIYQIDVRQTKLYVITQSRL